MADPGAPLTLAQHLPFLSILAPLGGLPFCLLLRGRAASAAWIVAIAAAGMSFLFACLSIGHVVAGGPLSYAMGGWLPPYGIELRVDTLNALVILLVSGMAFFSILFAQPLAIAQLGKEKLPVFYALFLICVAGLLGLCASADAFNIFVFLEISSLSTYGLVAMGARTDRRALNAAFNYLILGTLGGTFFVIGVGLVYQTTGELNMGVIARAVSQSDSRTLQLGFAFILIGLSLKAGLFPMHFWLPNAYSYAPPPVGVFLAATSTKVAMYVLIRFIFDVFYPTLNYVEELLFWVILPMGLLGIVSSSIVAIYQKDMRRMLAYSSVAQLGYMLVGITLLNDAALSGTILHIIYHAIIKATLFMGAGCVIWRLGGARLDDFRGLFKRMPLTAACISLGLISLVGLPPMIGFVSKWYFLSGALVAGRPMVMALILFSSLLSVIYASRWLHAMFFAQPLAVETRTPALTPVIMLACLVVMAAANIGLTLFGGWIIDRAGESARAILVHSQKMGGDG